MSSRQADEQRTPVTVCRAGQWVGPLAGVSGQRLTEVGTVKIVGLRSGGETLGSRGRVLVPPCRSGQGERTVTIQNLQVEEQRDCGVCPPQCGPPACRRSVRPVGFRPEHSSQDDRCRASRAGDQFIVHVEDALVQDWLEWTRESGANRGREREGERAGEAGEVMGTRTVASRPGW